MCESDIDLIKGIQNGDHHAFERLVQRYQGPLFNFLFKYTSDPQTAEDLSQEVFLRIFRAAHGFTVRPGAKFSTWLFKIAYNLAVNEFKRRKKFLDLKNTVSVQKDEPIEQQNLIWSKHRELEIEMLTALKAIPENQRAALLLRVYDALTYREISEVLGVTLSGVETLIFRARQHLKKHLKPPEKVKHHGLQRNL